MTLEDEEFAGTGIATPTGAGVGSARAGRYGGSFVVLIHPNIPGHKFHFERKFVAAIRGRAWFGSVGEFGRGGRRVPRLTSTSKRKDIAPHRDARYPGNDRRTRSPDSRRLDAETIGSPDARGKPGRWARGHSRSRREQPGSSLNQPRWLQVHQTSQTSGTVLTLNRKY